jgi:hypothetical protein
MRILVHFALSAFFKSEQEFQGLIKVNLEAVLDTLVISFSDLFMTTNINIEALYLFSPPARQFYPVESLHPPGHPATNSVLWQR